MSPSPPPTRVPQVPCLPVRRAGRDRQPVQAPFWALSSAAYGIWCQVLPARGAAGHGATSRSPFPTGTWHLAPRCVQYQVALPGAECLQRGRLLPLLPHFLPGPKGQLGNPGSGPLSTKSDVLSQGSACALGTLRLCSHLLWWGAHPLLRWPLWLLEAVPG